MVTEVAVTEAVPRRVVLGVRPRTTSERRVYAVKIARLGRLVTRPEYRRQLSLCTHTVDRSTSSPWAVTVS